MTSTELTTARRPSWRAMAGSVTLVRRAGGAAFLASVLLLATSSLGMVGLLIIGNAVLQDLVRRGEQAAASPWTMTLLIMVVLIAGVIAFASAAGAGLHRLLIERTVRYCSDATLSVSAKVPLREFESPRFHDRLERVRNNHTSALTIAMAVPDLAAAVIGAVSVVAGLAVINPLLVPITIASAVPLWVVGRGGSDEMYSFSFGNTPEDRARQNIESIINRRESAPEVRAFRLAGYLRDRWSQSYDARIAGITELVRRFVRRSAYGAAVSSAVLAAVFALVLFLVRDGRMTLPEGAAACIAVLLLANRCQQSATRAAQLIEHSRYVSEFLELRDWADALPEPKPVAIAPFTELTVDNVSFAYPAADRLALDGVSLTLRRGEVLAIVGHNGSGKTTLAKLLAGLYAPTSGSVRWDGRPIAELTPDGGLSEVGVVFQEFGRYWFTLADNIAVGDIARAGDQDSVRRAATRAGVTDFAADLPNGFDTPLGVEVDGGSDLSGGQWQRVAIARVLFRDASFLILDEPTAALDAEAEAALFATIADLAEGRTVVLISHRFSTVRSADRIAVLDHGRLVEEGSHAELIAANKRYARMYSLQASAYAV